MRDAREFRPDIEGLRGVAVLLVVATHATGWPRGGFLGVDVFFVLSGFLITGLLAGEAVRTGRVSLRAFYARRVRRLLPVGLLVLVVTDLAAALLLLPGRARATVVDSLWALGSVANVRFAQLGTDYFSQTRPPSAVQHYWSLSVEEQFYFVWPTAVVLTLSLARWRGWQSRRTLTVVALVVVTASFAWSVAATAADPVPAYFSAATRAWELGAGALLALLAPQLRRRPFLAGLGAAGLAASVLLIGPGTPVPGYAVALPVLATVALLAGAPASLGQPGLRYVGRLSYSLYLWHWPALVLAADLPGGATPAGRGLAVVVAVALSVASYHLVEAPVRASSWLAPGHRSHARRRPLLGLGLVLGSLVLLATSWTLTASGAAPPPVKGSGVVADPAVAVRAGLALTSWPPGLDDDLTDDAAPEWIVDGCLDVGPRNLEQCVYGDQAGLHTAVLVGDSVAISWLPGLREALREKGWRIQVLTRRQCPNAALDPGATRAVSESCAQHQQWVVEELQRLRPDLLIASNGYGGASVQQWASATRVALGRFTGLAGRTVVLAPPPETGNLQKCRTRLSAPPQCTREVSADWRAFSRVEAQAAGLVGARWVDTSGWFCIDQRCPAVAASTAVTFDGKHLSAGYARLLGPVLNDAIAQVSSRASPTAVPKAMTAPRRTAAGSLRAMPTPRVAPA